MEKQPTQDEVVLRDLAVPDLLGQCVLAVVHVGEEAKRAQAVSDLRCVVFLFNTVSSQRTGYTSVSAHGSERRKTDVGCGDGYDEDLAGRYPERPTIQYTSHHITPISISFSTGKRNTKKKTAYIPFASKMLRDDCDKALETAQDCTVDDHRPGHDGLVGGTVPQVEALGQLEVELDGRALE